MLYYIIYIYIFSVLLLVGKAHEDLFAHHEHGTVMHCRLPHCSVISKANLEVWLGPQVWNRSTTPSTTRSPTPGQIGSSPFLGLEYPPTDRMEPEKEDPAVGFDH